MIQPSVVVAKHHNIVHFSEPTLAVLSQASWSLNAVHTAFGHLGIALTHSAPAAQDHLQITSHRRSSRFHLTHGLRDGNCISTNRFSLTPTSRSCNSRTASNPARSNASYSNATSTGVLSSSVPPCRAEGDEHRQ